MSKQKIWRAAWPHVTVRIIDEASGLPTVVAFGEGGVLPPQADPADVERLAIKGAIVEVEPEPDSAKEKADAAKAKADAARAKAKADADAEADAKEKADAEAEARRALAKPVRETGKTS